MGEVISEALDLEIERRPERVEAWILRRLPEREIEFPPLRRHRAGSRWKSGRVEAVNAELEDLARGLESILGRPVLDEAGVSGRFDIDVQWTPEDIGSLRGALRSAGIDLVEELRTVDYLVFTVKVDDSAAHSPEAHATTSSPPAGS